MSIPEVAIIGAGPAGLFSVYACGMLGYRSYLFDFQAELGGQCVLYKDKPIYDIPGFPAISASELIRNLKTQHEPFRPEYHLQEHVLDILKTQEGFTIVTAQNRLTVKAIIIAGGIGAFGPRKPPLSNLVQFEGTSVFYHIDNKEFFRNKRLVIAGGGDSAVDWAIELSSIAASVHLVHRRSKFRCHTSSECKLNELIQDKKIVLEAPYQVCNLEGEKGQLSHVVLENIEHKQEFKTLSCDMFLPFFGLSANLGPLLKWDLSIKKDVIPVDIKTMETTREGIYAIGDIADYPHKKKLIMMGFAEAMTAAYAIRQYLNPNQVFHFEYSTSQGIKPL